MRHHTLLSLAAAICAVAAASPAVAQESKVDKAKALFEEAMAAHARGEYRDASSLLAKAYAYDPNLVYQYNRVMMLQLNGDYSEALEVLEIYEEPMLADEEGRFTNIPMLREKLTAQAAEKAEMEKMMAAKKAADAKEGPEAKDPEAKGEVSNPGDGDPAEDGAPLDPIEEPPAGPSAPILGYALIGTGAAAGIAGGLLAAGVFAPEYDPMGVASDEWEKMRVRQTQETASWALLASGAVLVGAGVVFVVLHDGGEVSPDDAEPATEPAATLELAPAVGPGFTGATLLGRF
jgi:hypothetical protein